MSRKVSQAFLLRRHVPNSLETGTCVPLLYHLIFFVYGDHIKVVGFITDYAGVERIIDHLKMTFIAEQPPPEYVFEQVPLIAAEASAEYY